VSGNAAQDEEIREHINDVCRPKSRSTKFGFMSKGLVWSSV
jgi:hypothetical protein